MENREIKFRGLTGRSEKAKMVFGSYHPIVGEANINGSVINLDLHYILQHRLPTDVGWYLHDSYLDNQVIKGTVGQFTGLKDKNGKEIYEGDIVECKHWNPSRYMIAFLDGAFCMLDGKSWPTDVTHMEDSTGKHFTVIGNIHQNPELL